ncbi:MAG: hypothetical protein ACLF0P_00570 [Thermoanaerobaculia bacterium]
MFARKKVVKIDVPADADLREAVDGAAMSPARCRAMAKDCHLVEAAWAADQVVASLDETVRGCFSELAASFGRLRLLVWINPQQEEDEPQACLEGDPRTQGRRLGT